MSDPDASNEDRERDILGGRTVTECLAERGGVFWLELSEEQTEALKAVYRDDAGPGPRTI